MKPGTLIMVSAREPRAGAQPLHRRTIGVVQEVHADVSLVVFKPLRERIWVGDYFDLGRDVPPSRVCCSLEEARPVFTLQGGPGMSAAGTLAGPSGLLAQRIEEAMEGDSWDAEAAVLHEVAAMLESGALVFVADHPDTSAFAMSAQGAQA